MNKEQGYIEVNSDDEEVTQFFADMNTVNSLIDRRRKDLEALIEQSKKQLRFLNDMKNTPNWINSYLEQEGELKAKVQKVLNDGGNRHFPVPQTKQDLQKVNNLR